MAKILLIDDSDYQRSIIARALDSEGHELIEAKNGREGLDKILSDKPSLVITDIVMPEMDGVSLLNELKAQSVQVPVVVVSADIQESTQKECMNLGAVGFVNKPVKGDALVNLKNLIACYLEG